MYWDDGTPFEVEDEVMNQNVSSSTIDEMEIPDPKTSDTAATLLGSIVAAGDVHDEHRADIVIRLMFMLMSILMLIKTGLVFFV